MPRRRYEEVDLLVPEAEVSSSFGSAGVVVPGVYYADDVLVINSLNEFCCFAYSVNFFYDKVD